MIFYIISEKRYSIHGWDTAFRVSVRQGRNLLHKHTITLKTTGNYGNKE